MENLLAQPREFVCPLSIGWKEYVALPEWGVKRIKAKVDTGARTSALDVLRYELHGNEQDGLVAELHLCLSRSRRRKKLRCKVLRVPVLRMVEIRSSSGQRERRPLVETTVRLGDRSKRILLTITNRRHMCFRMLLGRKALEADFLVDVSRKYVQGK